MEIINSFTDTIKERTKNPFFGTLIFVWLFRNWEIVFSIFNFDKGFGLAKKISFINAYYKDKLLLGMFTNNILIALALMILGYLLIVGTRVLVNVVENNLMPYLNSKTVSKLTVNKITYDSVRKARDEYFNQIFNLQEQLVLSEQKLTLEKSHKDILLREQSNLQNKISELNQFNQEMSLSIDKEKEKLNVVQEENFNYRTSLEKFALKDKLRVIRLQRVIGIMLEQYPINSESVPSNFENMLKLLPDDVKEVYYGLVKSNKLQSFIDYYNTFSVSEKILPNDQFESSWKLFEYFAEIDAIQPTAIADVIYLLTTNRILPIDTKKK